MSSRTSADPAPSRPEAPGAVPVLVAAASAVGALLTIAAFHPGYMSPDSVDQLLQARTAQFDAWHPPVMAWVWRHIDAAWPGPAGMLVLQVVTFYAGLGLAAGVTLRGFRGPAAVLAIGLLPPVFALLGTIWKDVQMGAALVMAVGLILVAERRGSRVALLLAIAPLWYATAARYNAVTAVFPIACWWAWVAGRSWSPLRLARGVPAGAVVAIVVATSASFASRAILDGRPIYPLQDCFVHDLVAISRVSGRDELPSWEYEGTGTAPIEYQRSRYSPAAVDSIVYWQYGYRHVTDPEKVWDLRVHWVDAVLRHPGTWARHRLALFGRLMGVEDSHLTYWNGIDANPFGIVHPRHALNRAVMVLLDAFRGSVLFRPWAWWLASLVLLAWAAATRRASAGTWALVASGTAYLLPFLEAAPSDDFRYVWWVTIAALIAPMTIWRLPRPRVDAVRRT
jgi:hypothetical protein